MNEYEYERGGYIAPMTRSLALIVLALILAGGCSSSRTARQSVSAAASQEEITHLRAVLNRRGGDPIMGQGVFRGRCAACHTAFGQGGDTAADLTAYFRRPDYRELLLSTLLTPTGSAAEAHAIRSFTLRDGTRYTGILLDDSAGQLTLATPGPGPGPGGNRVTISEASLDPDADITPRHLLTSLTDQQVRDLFAYLLREATAGE